MSPIKFALCFHPLHHGFNFQGKEIPAAACIQVPLTGQFKTNLLYLISLKIWFFLMIRFQRNLLRNCFESVFQLFKAGYWVKFSTSNNRPSVKPHWVRYCHCAKSKTTQKVQIWADKILILNLPNLKKLFT